jgi:hypothetical protein
MSEKPALKKSLSEKNLMIRECLKKENEEKAHCKEIFETMKEQRKKKRFDTIFDYSWRLWI